MSDPGIILQAGNFPEFGTSPNQLAQMWKFAQDVKDQQRADQNRNALKQIFSNPANVDPQTNMPNRNALTQIYKVDPQLGMDIQSKTLEAQARQAQIQSEKTDQGKAKFGYLTDIASVVSDTYDEQKKLGKSDQEAMEAATKARADFVQSNGGFLTDAEEDQLLSHPVNPQSAKVLANLNPERTREKHDEAIEDIAAFNAGLQRNPVTGEAVAPSSGASAPGGGSKAQTNLANNNPGNIKTADGKGFQSFPTMQAGIDAVGNQIQTYRTRDGLSTIEGIVGKYAPPSENDTKAYVAKVSAQTGIPAGQKLTDADIPKVRDAMIGVEQGGRTPQEILENPGGETVTGGKGWKVMHSASTGKDYRVNPDRGVVTDMEGRKVDTPPDDLAGTSSAQPKKGFSPEMGDLMAALAEKGVSLPTGFRSKEQQQALYQGILEKNPGKTPDEIAELIKKGQIEFAAQKKETQVAAATAGKVEVAVNEIEPMIGLVRAASSKVPRGEFVPVTKLLQTTDSSISDPNLKSLKIKINSLLNAYDLLAARGGTDVAKRAETRALLTSADGPEALESGMEAFEAEAKIAKAAAVKATKVPELADDPSGKQASGAAPKFIEGKIYTDAKGNKAKYENGKWVPVQ